MRKKLKVIKICFFFIVFYPYATYSASEDGSSCQQYLQEILSAYTHMNKYSAEFIRNYRDIKSFKSRLTKTIRILENSNNYDSQNRSQKIILEDFKNQLPPNVIRKVHSLRSFSRTIQRLNNSSRGGFCTTINIDQPIKKQLLLESITKITENEIKKNNEKKDKPKKPNRRRRSRENSSSLSEVRLPDITAQESYEEESINISKYSTSRTAPPDDQCNHGTCGICCDKETIVNYSVHHSCWYAKKGSFLPCGHVLCNTCKRKLTPRKCPWCRERF